MQHWAVVYQQVTSLRSREKGMALKLQSFPTTKAKTWQRCGQNATPPDPSSFCPASSSKWSLTSNPLYLDRVSIADQSPRAAPEKPSTTLLASKLTLSHSYPHFKHPRPGIPRPYPGVPTPSRTLPSQRRLGGHRQRGSELPRRAQLCQHAFCACDALCAACTARRSPASSFPRA